MHPAAEFVVALFGPHKSGRACVVSLPNVKTDGRTDGAPIYLTGTMDPARRQRQRHDGALYLFGSGFDLAEIEIGMGADDLCHRLPQHGTDRRFSH